MIGEVLDSLVGGRTRLANHRRQKKRLGSRDDGVIGSTARYCPDVVRPVSISSSLVHETTNIHRQTSQKSLFITQTLTQKEQDQELQLTQPITVSTFCSSGTSCGSSLPLSQDPPIAAEPFDPFAPSSPVRRLSSHLPEEHIPPCRYRYRSVHLSQESQEVHVTSSFLGGDNASFLLNSNLEWDRSTRWGRGSR